VAEQIMKAVEWDKLSAPFKKKHGNQDSLIDKGWWVQKKYDGCMGIATIYMDPGKCIMRSRTGGDYSASCGHLLRELHEAACSEMVSFDPFVVIGEVWRPIEEAKFPSISGDFRKQSPREHLRFIANDLLTTGLDTGMPYRDRFRHLCLLLPDVPNSGRAPWQVTVAETFTNFGEHFAGTKVNDVAAAWQASGGFDGAIMRDPNSGYKIGLVKNGEIIKVKPLTTLDLRVTGVSTDVGEKTGRAVYSIDVTYDGVISSVGSGIPHHIDDVPAIGQIVEIACLGVTEEGKLREPRFKGVRFDKEQPD
jgi:ATP-dependent DNA ligase